MKNTQFFTIEEVAELLKVSEMTIYRYIKARKLTAYKLGRKAYRINNTDLKAFLNKVKTK
ncbi:DNA binding domain protein, excisionase family [Elusimicrobium minutum Pei191]|uniref:DNA binding domain protein, excisionase family n=1 Tax=Elusimicrobium minutum (strain Pei191) TaxID=445932 RepID=B2KB33_ELUMP|nr:helix-turn-helix domain-containing protein [Elusimicrobium minutum]ACC97792.1 DNA binding domain protein, excisionase family [Elusimicrobium minutum Pei191]